MTVSTLLKEWMLHIFLSKHIEFEDSSLLGCDGHWFQTCWRITVHSSSRVKQSKMSFLSTDCHLKIQASWSAEHWESHSDTAFCPWSLESSEYFCDNTASHTLILFGQGGLFTDTVLLFTVTAACYLPSWISVTLNNADIWQSFVSNFIYNF